MKKINLLLFSAVLSASTLFSQKKNTSADQADKKTNDTKAKPTETLAPILKSDTYSALSFRSIGPAVTSGRVIDLAVNPKNKSEWYVAAAAGGVWKTSNAGVTFNPIF